MEIKPNKIKTPFFARILLSSFKLITKKPIAWIFFIVVVFLTALPTVFIPNEYFLSVWMLLLQIIIGVWLILLGLEISGQVDCNTFETGKIWKYMAEAARGTVFLIKENIIYLIILSLGMLWLSFSLTPRYNAPVMESSFYTYWSADIAMILFLGIIFINLGRKFFYFQIIRVFNPKDKKTASNLSVHALNVNSKIKGFVYLWLPLLVFAMPIYGFTIGVQFLAPFIPIIMYLIFKEIFLSKSIEEIQKEALKTKTI